MKPQILDEVAEKVESKSLTDFQISACLIIPMESVQHLKSKHYDHFAKVPNHVAEGWSSKMDYIMG